MHVPTKFFKSRIGMMIDRFSGFFLQANNWVGIFNLRSYNGLISQFGYSLWLEKRGLFLLD
jgi:hypothetical protein